MPWWIWLPGGLFLVAALVYWLLAITEGAYLGPRTVAALYDRYADRYDDIKQFETADEAFFLGRPLLRFLEESVRPATPMPDGAGDPALLLDVACGTGRLPLALGQAAAEVRLQALREGRSLADPRPCQVVALDSSLGMLQNAYSNLAGLAWPAVALMQQDAAPLPFPGEQFHAVTCLEALEFMPSPPAVIGELIRVLRSGGFLVITNRIGWQSRLMPGKSFDRRELEELLRSLGMTGVRLHVWQVDYDLVTAHKPGEALLAGSEASSPDFPASILACPRCQGRSWRQDQSLACCQDCGWQLTLRDGIWRWRQPGGES